MLHSSQSYSRSQQTTGMYPRGRDQISSVVCIRVSVRSPVCANKSSTVGYIDGSCYISGQVKKRCNFFWYPLNTVNTL